jgi:hypothetical protein
LLLILWYAGEQSPPPPARSDALPEESQSEPDARNAGLQLPPVPPLVGVIVSGRRLAPGAGGIPEEEEEEEPPMLPEGALNGGHSADVGGYAEEESHSQRMVYSRSLGGDGHYSYWRRDKGAALKQMLTVPLKILTFFPWMLYCRHTPENKRFLSALDRP